MNPALERVERIIDASAVAERIETLLPVGVRPRQLRVRTLMVGMVLAMLAGRDALLTNVLQALLELPEADRRRLGVIAQQGDAEHQLTYRQLEYTHRLITSKLARPQPDGSPSETLSAVLDALLEASVTVLGEPDSSSYTVDWTDHQTWSRPPPKQRADPGETPAPEQDVKCADPEASWGHRTSNHPANNEMFFGYYLQAITTVKDDHGPPAPELVRRIHLASCDHDPPAQIIPVIQRMTASGIELSELLVDSGYSYRLPEHWALPIRQLGIQLIMDLHPNDRGPRGTHHGAICHNGNLYCPATPTALLELAPLPPSTTPDQTDAHDQQSAELARYKLSAITSYDNDGYRRVSCPAAQAKLRCPHRPDSLTLPHDRPTVLTPPEHPPVCCQQQTITVPPSVNPKTAQKHDYPSATHRASYNRRTAAERTFATLTDRATNDLSRGWCRLTGLAPIALLTATALIARNIRVANAFAARQSDNQRRAAAGLPPRQRRRRRQTITDLIDAANPPPQPAAAS